METVIIALLLVIFAILTWDRLRSGQRWREQSDHLAKSVGEQIAGTTRVFGEVKESLGKLTERTQHIQEVGRNIASLQEILRAPKARGGLGELLLERLLADCLPTHSYRLQYSFRNGETVDAVVRIGENWVPIDAKFPVEDFERMAKADSDEARTDLNRQFARTVKKHIDAVAKYIRPDEETFDFALMYVPAENIYYETICQSGIYETCLRKKVFLVSPNSFYAYLQAIVLGLRGLRIEKTAHNILGHLGRLQVELAAFQDEYDTLGRHIRNAAGKYDDAERKLTRFSEKLKLASDIPSEQLPEGDTKTPGEED